MGAKNAVRLFEGVCKSDENGRNSGSPLLLVNVFCKVHT